MDRHSLLPPASISPYGVDGLWHEITVPTSSFSTPLCRPPSPSPSPSPHHGSSGKPLLSSQTTKGEEAVQKHPTAEPWDRADAGSPKWYPPRTSGQRSTERAASLPCGAEPGLLCSCSSQHPFSLSIRFYFLLCPPGATLQITLDFPSAKGKDDRLVAALARAGKCWVAFGGLSPGNPHG